MLLNGIGEPRISMLETIRTYAMEKLGGAGEADDADAAASGWGGDGDDGVFFKLRYGEVGHGKPVTGDFFMVTGEKILRGGGCFCRDFWEKWGAERGCFDGETVVDWW